MGAAEYALSPGRRGAVGPPQLARHAGRARDRRRVPRAVPQRQRGQAASRSRVECGDADEACATVKRVLRDAGVPATGSSLGATGTQNVIRVVVGTVGQGARPAQRRGARAGPQAQRRVRALQRGGRAEPARRARAHGSRRGHGRRPGGRHGPARRRAGLGGHGGSDEGVDAAAERARPGDAARRVRRGGHAGPAPRSCRWRRSEPRPRLPPAARARCTPRAPGPPPRSAARSRWCARSTSTRWSSLAVLAGVLGAGVAAGVGAELRRTALLSVPLALLIALVNPLVYQGGDTLLVRGGTFLGQALGHHARGAGGGRPGGPARDRVPHGLRPLLRLRRPRRAAAPVPARVVPLGAHRVARHPARAGARARRAADGRRGPLPPAAPRPAGGGPGGAGERARPRGRRGGRARGARLLARRAARAGPAAAVVAARPAGGRGGRPDRRSPPSPAGRWASASSSSTRRWRSRPGPARACLIAPDPARLGASVRRGRGAAGGGPCWLAPAASPTPTRSAPSRRCATSRSRSPRAASRCSPACRGRASRPCCARCAASCPTSTAAR